MEHPDGDEVVVDVATDLVASVHMDCIQHRHKIILAQSVDKVIHHQLEATEAASNCLLTFVLQRLAYRYNNDPPAVVAYLLPTLLDDLFESFYHSKLILAVV